MAFKVFISHSVQDMDLVNSFKDMLSQKGLEAYVAVSEPEPGRKITDKVRDHIQSSSYFLLLLTKESVKSSWVQNEIGIALSMKKTIIPLVEKGVKVPSIIQDIEHIEFDSSDPNECISNVTEYLFKIKVSKEERKFIICIILVLLGIIVLATLLSSLE